MRLKAGPLLEVVLAAMAATALLLTEVSMQKVKRANNMTFSDI